MKRVYLLIGISTLLLATQAHAQFSKYSNDFMNIGVDARSLAMGNSVTATVDDVTAGYWNPAGLMQMKQGMQISFMEDDYFAGIGSYQYLGVALPISDNSRRLAFSLIRFAVDNIPNTLYLYQADGSVNYNNVTSFSAADYAGIISYAQDIKPIKGLSIGVNAKLIHNIVGNFAQSWGFGADLGAQYRHNNLSLGLMLRDVTTTYNAWSFSFSQSDQAVLAATDNIIPTSSVEYTAPQIIVGGGYMFKIKQFGIMPCIDVDVTTDGERNTLISSHKVAADPHAGVEINYKKLIFLRAGINNIQKATDDLGKPVTLYQPNIGVGAHFKMLTLDLAFTNLGDGTVVPNSYVVSIKLDLNKKK